MDAVCLDCGKGFARVSRAGRPRVRCEVCSPPQLRGPRIVKCARCSASFDARGSQKYCARSCRDKDVWDRQKAANPCPGCGEPMARASTSSADEQRCRKCKFGGREHGTTAMYDKGKCRCSECKAAVAKRQREYAARRKAAGNKINYSSYRSTVPAVCEQCSISFLSRTDEGVRRFCSLDCANDFQGRNDSPRIAFKIAKSARLAIYEAAGWACSLCKCPTRPDEDSNHPRYPTLDHIQPRSLGGGDELENLRLACRQCNTLRGNNVDWVPELSEVRDESSREVA